VLQDMRKPLVREPDPETLEILEDVRRYPSSRTMTDSLPYTSTIFTAMRLSPRTV